MIDAGAAAGFGTGSSQREASYTDGKDAASCMTLLLVAATLARSDLLGAGARATTSVDNFLAGVG